jgi:hypothetical protein
MQNTSHILMIRPVSFGYNAETAVNNSFQVNTGNFQETASKAILEFDAFVQKLRDNGVDVLVYQDIIDPHTPDSIFPNNWISFHEEGIICQYPMFAENRRKERNNAVIQLVKENFKVKEQVDFTYFEAENLYNEGTGSMVLDRDHKIAYACLSPRTDVKPLQAFCKEMQYKAVCFNAFGENGNPIYHTNVMMCVADRYVVICLDAITNPQEKLMVSESITGTGKKIIPISIAQMNNFAGNMLQVVNNKGQKILVMSHQAYESLYDEQADELESFNPILYASLNTIETNGGGSARCMMAEVFLPEISS